MQTSRLAVVKLTWPLRNQAIARDLLEEVVCAHGVAKLFVVLMVNVKAELSQSSVWRNLIALS